MMHAPQIIEAGFLSLAIVSGGFGALNNRWPMMVLTRHQQRVAWGAFGAAAACEALNLWAGGFFS